MKITLPPITPGPWHHTGNYVSSAPKGGIRIAWNCGDGPQPQWQPNFKAIAATPATLQALADMVMIQDDPRQRSHRLAEIRAWQHEKNSARAAAKAALLQAGATITNDQTLII